MREFGETDKTRNKRELFPMTPFRFKTREALQRNILIKLIVRALNIEVAGFETAADADSIPRHSSIPRRGYCLKGKHPHIVNEDF